MYTDETILPSGRYQYHKISQVPASYLLRMQKEMLSGKRVMNEELSEYIKENFDKLVAIRDGKKAPEKKAIPTKAPDNKIGHKVLGNSVMLFCNEANKIIFPNEKDAKQEIKRIRKLEQKNKKPERAYECVACGGWHLTSVSFEDWNGIENR